MAWNIAVGIFGVLAVAIVFFDVVLTAFSAYGEGPLTQLVSRICRVVLIDLPSRWERKLFHRYYGETLKDVEHSQLTSDLSHWTSRIRRHMMSYVGVISLLVIIAVWLSVFIFGWTCVFYFSDENLLYGSTGEFVPFSAITTRLYFAAFVGLGEIHPAEGPWQIATAFAFVTTTILFSLLLSYLIGITSSTQAARGTAANISVWGATPAEILLNSWDGESFTPLIQYLGTIIDGLTDVDMQVHVYPISSLYISSKLDYSLGLRLASLDEAITFLLYSTQKMDYELRKKLLPDLIAIRSFKRAMNHYLASLKHQVFFTECKKAPPPTFTAEVVHAMSKIERDTPPIPEDLFDLNAYHEALENPLLQARRRMLKSLVHHSGNVWHSIFHSELNDRIRPKDESKCDCTSRFQVRHVVDEFFIEGGYKY